MKPVRRRRPSRLLPWLAGAALGAAALSSTSAQAAAYYAGEIGARSVARGGANLVNPGDPSAVWLNPAAITLSSGVQLQLDGNLVFLTSEFVRDCGGEPNGCAVLDDIEREYRDPTTGRTDAARAVRLPGGRRRLSSNVAAAEPGQLGSRNTPSRFDGETTVVRNLAGPQPIPRLMATFNGDTVGLPGLAVGAFVYAPSSGDYRFGEDAATRYTLIDRDLLEVFYGVTVGYRFDNWIAVGASLQGVTAGLDQSIRLGIDKYGNEDPGYDVQVRIRGMQHLIPSGNIGVWSSPLKPLGIDLQLGGSVQLPRHVQATGALSVEKIGDKARAEFFDAPPGGQPLATLSSEGATATAEFVLPPFWRVGAKYTNDDILKSGAKIVGVDLEVDYVLEQWSTYDHVFLTTKDLTFSALGAEPEPLPPIVQPKDWVDAWSVRAGGTVSFFDRILEVHGGAFYETSAIPDSTYTIEVVDSDKVGVGAGVSARMWGARLDVAYGHIFYADRVIGQQSIVTAGNVAPPAITGDNDPVTRVAMGRYTAGLGELNVGLTVAFDELFGFGVHAPPPVVPVVTPPPEAPAPTETAPEQAPTPAPEQPKLELDS
jgi:long-subunit fatty acid transport protein